MPPEGRPKDLAIHATAVAIGDLGLLIQGPSRSGKSGLASDLLARSTRARPIVLIGDDRILLETTPRGVIARPHPRIAGFIERRGLGLCAVPYRDSAAVALLVHLGPAAQTHPVLANFPALTLVKDSTRVSFCDDVLAGFGRLFNHLDSAARGPQVGAKAGDATASAAKD